MDLVELDRLPNLVTLFYRRADERGDDIFLGYHADGEWRTISWREAAEQVSLMAQSLTDLGLGGGDRIMIVSENRPEWCIGDLAIMAAGCVTVPTYTTNTERDHQHILDNSGARAVIVSNAKLAKPLLPAIVRTGKAELVVAMEDLQRSQSGSFEVHNWADLLQGDAGRARSEAEKRIADIGRDDMACIIYTSGTGGAPRGVMQHHGAILCDVAGTADILLGDFPAGKERFLSFLPLSHAYEHTAGQYFPIAIGAEIYYAQGLDKLASNIEQTSPTVMVVVPRLFEVLRARILKQINKQGKAAQIMMNRAVAMGERRSRGKKSLIDAPMNTLLNTTLRRQIRKRFGGRIKAMVSGGAPLNPEVGNFFESIGLTLLQGYGQTEASPVISCNRPSAGIKMNTVGPPLRGVKVKISDDGEILVRSEVVTHGYWRNKAETARTIIDGWLHTGDVGHFDEKGRIVITDRMKDMIVNDKGDNISPQKVEGMLTLQPEIAQAMVSGNNRPYLVGLIVPDSEWAHEWARQHGHPYDLAVLQNIPDFQTAVRKGVDRVNRDLSVIEKVRRSVFADEPFSIENEEMTPSLKIRRHKIRERYDDRLDALYKK